MRCWRWEGDHHPARSFVSPTSQWWRERERGERTIVYHWPKSALPLTGAHWLAVLAVAVTSSGRLAGLARSLWHNLGHNQYRAATSHQPPAATAGLEVSELATTWQCGNGSVATTGAGSDLGRGDGGEEGRDSQGNITNLSLTGQVRLAWRGCWDISWYWARLDCAVQYSGVQWCTVVYSLPRWQHTTLQTDLSAVTSTTSHHHQPPATSHQHLSSLC